MKERIFVSSVQKEFAAERRAIRDFIEGNRLLAKHFEVFIFEDLPAGDRRPDEMYLDEVERCSVFVALFGAEYGWEDPEDGLSPTEREFDRATELAKHRLLFLKSLDKAKPHPKMAALTDRARTQLVYRRFTSIADLTSLVYNSLIEYLEERGVIKHKPFDAAPCEGAALRGISAERMKWFLQIARRERNLHLPISTGVGEALTHLNLVSDGNITNAAMLLFGVNPQRYATSAVVKCAHFHGTEVAKPVPSHQVFEGTLFEQVDGAVDFVMSKLSRTVGTRASGPEAPIEYEVPKAALAEIIVNAVAHRDYTSAASVQVFVFADRVEVWNPGHLPRGLRLDDLRVPHSSEPVNPLIARPLYLAHYIESLGTGTLDVIRLCREAGLPLPEFQQRGSQFVVTLWRDWVTAEVLARVDLNDRQRKALTHLKSEGRLTNKQYQELAGVTDRTALRDLDDLVREGLVAKVGKGRGTHYVLQRRTRQEPDKPDTLKSESETRQKPDKPDTPRIKGPAKKSVQKPVAKRPTRRRKKP